MALLQSLKISLTHSRPRTSNDKYFIESLFKTLKYHVTYPDQLKAISGYDLTPAQLLSN